MVWLGCSISVDCVAFEDYSCEERATHICISYLIYTVGTLGG